MSSGSRHSRSRLFCSGASGNDFLAGHFAVFYRVLSYFQSVEDFSNILAVKLLSMLMITFSALLLFSNIINHLSNIYLSRDLPPAAWFACLHRRSFYVAGWAVWRTPHGWSSFSACRFFYHMVLFSRQACFTTLFLWGPYSAFASSRRH